MICLILAGGVVSFAASKGRGKGCARFFYLRRASASGAEPKPGATQGGAEVIKKVPGWRLCVAPARSSNQTACANAAIVAGLLALGLICSASKLIAQTTTQSQSSSEQTT